MNYRARTAAVLFLMSMPHLTFAGDGANLAREIDRLIEERLAKEQIPLSPLADDAEFLRRVYLDLVGRIPTYEQTTAFLTRKEPDKRARLIDELLDRPEYGVHFGTVWRELIVDRTPEMSQVRQLYSWEFRDWLADHFNKDRGWNEVVAEMLTHEGASKGKPAAVFLLSNRMNDYPRPADIVGTTGKLFMGVQVRCAQCHDHPFVERWKQDDFWGLAAFFGQLRDHAMKQGQGSQNPTFVEEPLSDSKANASYNNGLLRAGLLPPVEGPKVAIPTVMDPAKTQRVVSARYFLQQSPELPEKGPYRANFAQWLTSPQNPYFARASVNRLWAHFFARGLASIEDMRPDQKPTHPALLDLLEAEYKKAGFKNKALARAICNSQAYQRTSKPLPKNVQDRELYSHMAIKQLSPDQMVDSLNIAVGRTSPVGKNREQFTALFATAEADADPTEYSHGIPQFLQQMNAGVAKDLKYVPQRFVAGKSKAEALDAMYLAVLSRPVRPAEVDRLTKYLDQAPNLQQGYQDVYWMLLNCAEFTLNH